MLGCAARLTTPPSRKELIFFGLNGSLTSYSTGVREPLSLRQVELGLPAFFDVEVDPDPIEERSVVPSESLGATEEPAVMAFGVCEPENSSRQESPC
jgi:hypothetical protein